MKLIRLAVVLLVLVIVLPVWGQETETLTVFAAVSLTDAFEEIGAAFEAEHPGVDVVFNFGGSSTLATQIVEGAPAHIFASANIAQMNVVRDAGLIEAMPRTFVTNRLVLIVPADNPAQIETLQDLGNDGVKIVVAAPGVPVRDYTDVLFKALVADYGDDFYAAVYANIVSEEDNVRQVAAKIALGEADAGIVYRSDVTPDLNESVLALPIPAAYNTVAIYPISALKNSSERAQTFMDMVLSERGQDILAKWGFIPVLPSKILLPEPGIVTVDGLVVTPLSLNIADVTQPIRLWDLLIRLGAEDNLNQYIVATGRDGRQKVISWVELRRMPIELIAEQGSLTLVHPIGRLGAVMDVANISVRKAPGVGNGE